MIGGGEIRAVGFIIPRLQARFESPGIHIDRVIIIQERPPHFSHLRRTTGGRGTRIDKPSSPWLVPPANLESRARPWN